MRPFTTTLALLAAAVTTAGLATGVASAAAHQAPILVPAATATARPVEDTYIVTLDERGPTARPPPRPRA
ncbi:hypothetical protein FHS29_000131 [Saccharothrix tamanrassetensis]|uniref:Uncharacterized protein n=1 Tax=Saccharothrix tamanrassetensis TaxID=1051531 RepID=A0A841C8W4_9PSEU|nr:hypothetical protein [Saccharothrix tamanrassetensis]MBB5953561.1 hypothetical protein [Saccharothrix tamanrassetensis]